MSSMKIILESSDRVTFEVDEAVALESETIKHDVCGADKTAGKVIMLKVNSKTLQKVIEYLQKHVEASDDLKAWDANFVNVELTTLFDLILHLNSHQLFAANYMKIPSLMELTCEYAMDMLAFCSPEELALKYKVNRDFSPITPKDTKDPKEELAKDHKDEEY